MTIDKSAIRNAATVIVIRDRMEVPSILMGQRGATAAFMPNKFVFPGGAVDMGDADIPLATALTDVCATRISEDTDPAITHAIPVAAIRELWEETGLILGVKGQWPGVIPNDWRTFAQTGHLPNAAPLQFVFRALTPPGRPRRFDARFFLVDVEDISSDPDNFDAACDELSHLQWVPLSEARKFDMPFITEVVLAEVEARAKLFEPPKSVPYFRNDEEESLFLRLKGHRGEYAQKP